MDTEVYKINYFQVYERPVVIRTKKNEEKRKTSQTHSPTYRYINSNQMGFFHGSIVVLVLGFKSSFMKLLFIQMKPTKTENKRNIQN